MREQLKLQTHNSLETEYVTPVTWTMLLRQEKDGVIKALAAKRVGSELITFPGGKINHNELPIHAATRELLEETGIKIDPECLIHATPQPVPHEQQGKKQLSHPFFTFFSENDIDRIQNTEPNKHMPWQWYSLRELFAFMLKGHLPYMTDEWFEIAIESFFVAQLPESSPLPAHILDDCESIRIEAEYQHFRKRAYA